MNMDLSKRKVFLLVAGLASVNYFVIGGLLGTIGFNAGRVILAAWGGWYLVYRTNSSLWIAALVGIVIMLVDHIVLKGGSFLLTQVFWPESVQNQGLLSFGGVLISFVMFSPIAALISFGGGIVGRKTAKAR